MKLFFNPIFPRGQIWVCFEAIFVLYHGMSQFRFLSTTLTGVARVEAAYR